MDVLVLRLTTFPFLPSTDEDRQRGPGDVPERGRGPAGRGQDPAVCPHGVLDRPVVRVPAEGTRVDRHQLAEAVRTVAAAGPLQAVAGSDRGGREEAVHVAAAKCEGRTRPVPLQRTRRATAHE